MIYNFKLIYANDAKNGYRDHNVIIEVDEPLRELFKKKSGLLTGRSDLTSSEDELIAYPNLLASTNILHLCGESARYDISGKILYTVLTTDPIATLSTHGLKPVYGISFVVRDKETETLAIFDKNSNLDNIELVAFFIRSKHAETR